MAGFRAIEPSHLLRLSPADFNFLLQNVSSVRDEVTQALLSRVGGLEAATIAAQRLPMVVGTRFDGAGNRHLPWRDLSGAQRPRH